MSSSQGLLEVVETNPFKHLVHLSLKFVSGTDEDVKNHLAACLKRVKDEKELLQKQLRLVDGLCTMSEYLQEL